MKRANLFLLILCCILLNHAANAALTATTTIANCNQQGSISLSSTFGAVISFSYAGTSSGTVTGNSVNLNCGTYSVTATLNNGATETASNIIVDHEDHIQLKNWYLTGNIPSTSVNWGATLNDPTMTGWTGLSFYANRCLRFINLTGKGITGNIPNFSFSNIDKIILTNNSMNGTIPNFNMPKLTYLDIARNQFSGNIPNFSSLPMLQILLLNDNQLSGTIPNFAGSPDMKSLNLSLNKLSGTIPNFNFPLLHSLYLNYNQLSGQIPPFNFPNLYLLDLSGNNLSGCIPIEIKMNSFNISSSNGNISGNPNLYNQDWSTYYGANSVGACMSCLAATATISVTGYKLNASTNLTSPKYLWSSGETNSSINITNSGTYSVTITQSNGCTKSASIMTSVPFSSTITNASCGNQGKIEFPSNSNIVSYAYAGTSAGAGQGKSINLAQGVYNVTLTESNGATSTISNLTIDNEEHQFLKNWYLNNEGIAWNVNWGATINDATMASWTGITKDINGCVSEIDLANKLVRGTILNFNFLKLKKISLSYNLITGNMPNFNLPNLTILDLAYNKLTSTIPNFNLPNLQNLYLNNNQLTGSIPNFASSPDMKTLNLSSNLLSGTIPNFNFPSLINLYLDNNQLSGQIPPFNFPNLYLLYLNNNNLSGCIPSEIRYNSPNIGSNGNLTANPKLYNQNWSTYYGANSVGACMSCLAATATISVAGYKLNASTNLTSPKYLWSNGETNSSINVTNPGTYSVTATQGNGCTKSATITLSMPFSSIITNASCGSQGKIEFPSNSNIVSYAYAGTSAGAGQGKSINLAQGVYNVTLTESSGATSTISNLTIDNEEHQFLKNWYLNNEGIAWNVNWGATINDATMTGWTGITTNANGCITAIQLSFCNIRGNLPNFNLSNLQTLYLNNNQLSGNLPNFNLPNLQTLYLNINQLSGTIPNFNLPNLQTLYLNNNQLSGCIPIEIKYNSPLIGTTGGNVSNNPSLNTQSWSNYWNSNTGTCPAAILNGKVFLNSVNSTTGLMDDYLKTLQSFPKIDPYSYHPLDTVFKHVNNPIIAQVPTSTLSVTGNNSIVDWVFLELRNGTSGSTSVAYTKSALLQKDGDIVGMNGTSPVIFDNTTPGNYYVTVRHRNHLGFRTANPIALSLTPTTLNFTNNSVLLYGATPLTALNTTLFAMNGGDANFDGSIDAFDSIKWEQQNGLFDEYTNNADYNLDGSVDALDTILWELNNGKYQELD